MRGNTDQKNSEYGHFLRSGRLLHTFDYVLEKVLSFEEHCNKATSFGLVFQNSLGPLQFFFYFMRLKSHTAQLTFTCSKSTIETLEKVVNRVQS